VSISRRKARSLRKERDMDNDMRVENYALRST
jgi:hypothetical protein